MSNYTEGPWFAGKPFPDANGITEIVTVGTHESDEHYEETICQVVSGEYDAVANARFIALAPDMFEALEELAEAWDIRRSYKLRVKYQRMKGSGMKKAIAVIAKVHSTDSTGE